MHTSINDLTWEANPDDSVEGAVITLGENDTADNPASTKHVIPGPAVVTYFKYKDGGIEAMVI